MRGDQSVRRMQVSPIPRGPLDPDRINIHESWELRAWAKLLDATEDQIVCAVILIGPKPKDVKQYLGK